MAAPTQPVTSIPAWCEDPTFNSGIETGVATTLAMTNVEVPQGWKPGKVVARKLNWLFKQVFDWLRWLKFACPNFSTGSTHTMTGTCQVTGGVLDWRGNVVLGNNSTANTVVVNAIETHNGAEVHYGTATQNGAQTFNQTVAFQDVISRGYITNGGFRRNASPCYYAGNANHTATELVGGSFIFKGLTTGRSLDLTIAAEHLVDNLQFTVYNDSGTYEVDVVVNGSTLGYVGGGGGSTTQKLFFYELDTISWRTS